MPLIDDVGLAPLARDLVRVEDRLRDAVRADDRFLGEVAGHLLAAGRQAAAAHARACARPTRRPGAGGPATDDVVTGGAAVELVHLGSLYHDDVIDEAETRRGVPSVNARWSNIVAILAGDYLLAQASSLAASLGADVAALLAATIGELCRGQVLELQYLFDVDRTEESYLSAIEGKTASLMATACRIGGDGEQRVGRHPRRADAVRPPPRHVLPGRRRRARRHRAPKPSSASPPATTCTKASTRCP